MNHLRFGLAPDEIDFYHVVQPIVNLTTNTVHGYEVLIRSKQFQNPERLFEYARQKNQLANVDLGSIFEAFQKIIKDISMNHLYIFVNVFPSTLADSTFYDLLQHLKSYSHMEACHIVFEINEYERATNFSTIKKVIQAIRNEGFLIAFDDIGKGEFMLSSILELNPDIAKMDRYFAENLAASPKKQKALQSMLTLFDNNTEVIVEGFESVADLQTARELGVTYGQGYVLGKPKPIKDYMSGEFPDQYIRLWRLQDG
ncbi:EAL domain, c-di-GMP-specific phosphodiesterase class I (or its enzymatically inactive variant) [Lentibacillus halodurans]|uniref:EAL domain, c-di-GMP-specific phosphodiesterase class I (Or its enzymatically inactive variant) n=1 Tax=Lentibacillus halodurans TaxID=237679 RepID=A0A1I1AD62_9BACI|nr:EAL domain-containing protein [Lentibacillus halodurans]SFB35945.1 EAL domain, c-di-GMP-specific phosphodiesterase class I (or its enzymatically inactive variant) [Lentibacillus halodurans]